jgi:hypothetical protein
MAAPAPAYAPYPAAPPAMAPQPPSRAAQWIALAVLLLAGAGTGIYFGFIKKDGKEGSSIEQPGPSEPGADNPWGSGGSGASDPSVGPGPTPLDPDDPDDPDDPPSGDDPNEPMRPLKISNVGGQLYSKPGSFRLLVPPEMSMRPTVQDSPNGPATRWTFTAKDDPRITITVIATTDVAELDLDDPAAVAESFGRSSGMELTSWGWRTIQGQRALSASYHVSQGGASIAIETVIYVKAKGALVVMFTCDASAFAASKDYRDSIFTQRISW